MRKPAYNPDDDKRPAVQRPLKLDSLYGAARAVNNAKRPRASISPTTNAPTDGEGNRSVVTGRFTCVVVYLRHWDSDSRRAFKRYVSRQGISFVVVDEINGHPSAVDVAGIDGKRDADTGEWQNGEALDTFLSQSFVVRWEYRSTARVSTIGGGSTSLDSLSPAKQREMRQSASGLRRYDLQPSHKAHDVDTSAPVAHKTETPIETMFRVMMIAENCGVLPLDMAGQLIDLYKNGQMDAHAITDSVVPLIVPTIE